MRKNILTAFLLACAIMSPAAGTSDSAIPNFVNYGMMLERTKIPNYPVKDCISPGVIKVSGYISSPLGAYYMYFAPHDGPGIWLAYADSLTGPWTVYGELFNSNSWGMNVSHISSPDPIWISEESKVFVYFHGENQDTKYAVSEDGINFSYGGRIVSGDYGRVHKYTIPRYNNKYILLTSTNNNRNTRETKEPPHRVADKP